LSTITQSGPTDAEEPRGADDPATGRLRHQLAVVRHDLAALGDRPLRDAHGGVDTVRGATARITDLRMVIRQDVSPARHRRISTTQRLLCRLLPVLDGAVLLWFLLEVLNVNPRRLLTSPNTYVAIALALLGTVALAAWAGAVGEHLARFVDDRRRLAGPAIDVIGRTMLVLTALVWLLLAAMMFVRVRAEVGFATGVTDISTDVIAAALAAAVVVVNAYVLYLAWSDGSEETREIEMLSRAVAPHLRARRRLWRRAADLAERIAKKEAAQRATDRRRT
jgi:hypothetical protein